MNRTIGTRRTLAAALVVAFVGCADEEQTASSEVVAALHALPLRVDDVSSADLGEDEGEEAGEGEDESEDSEEDDARPASPAAPLGGWNPINVTAYCADRTKRTERLCTVTRSECLTPLRVDVFTQIVCQLRGYPRSGAGLPTLPPLLPPPPGLPGLPRPPGIPPVPGFPPLPGLPPGPSFPGLPR